MHENRSRAKRRKPPLADHHVLTISPRIKRYVVGSSVAHGHANLRVHMVRGHFKVRRTGIYFWRPHMRGDPVYGAVDKSYRVTA